MCSVFDGLMTLQICGQVLFVGVKVFLEKVIYGCCTKLFFFSFSKVVRLCFDIGIFVWS